MRHQGLALLLAAVGCGGAQPAGGGDSVRPQLRRCAAAGEDGVCGSLVVTEDPGRSGGRVIRLHFVVLRARTPRPDAVPLFHLEGGPGVAATGSLAFYRGPGRDYWRSRDLVILDQRGTGSSNPLRCPAIEARSRLVEQYTAADVDACRTKLSARADLRRYGTEVAAEDLDRVRAALGHPIIDLWAISYGTQLAQVYLREHPERVRRLVLAGAAPLDLRTPLHHAAHAQQVLDRLLAQCQADTACAAAHPQLAEHWHALLARLDAGPVTAAAADGRVVELRRAPFGEAFRRMLNTTTGQRRVPLLIDRAAAGNLAPLLAALQPEGGDPVAEGLYLSNACAEGTLHIDPSAIAPATAGTFAGDHRVRNQLDACRRWPVVPVPASFFRPVRSPVPVLILAGDMDATTPASGARSICAMLGNCRVIEIPALAHAPLDLDSWQGGDCYDRLAVAFFEATADPLGIDASCVTQMKPPPFAQD